MGVNVGDDAAEGVIRGEAVGEFEVVFEPVFFGVGELFDIRPSVGPAKSNADGNEENVVECTEFVTRGSWRSWKCSKSVGKVGKQVE